MRRIGIDLALRAPHRAAIFDDAEAVGASFPVTRDKAGIDHLIRRATAGQEGPCEFIMEPTGFAWLPLAAELVRRGHRTYVPKPQKTHALRKFLREHTKTDATDATAAALLRHVDQSGVHELRVPTPQQLSLQMFVKQRARMIADASKSKQRIRAVLILAHPLLGEVLGEALFAKLGRRLLRKHLDPARVLLRGRSNLRRVWSLGSRAPVDEEQFSRVWAAYEEVSGMYEGLRDDQQLPFDYEDVQHVVDQELDTIEFIEHRVTELDRRIRVLYRAVDPDQLLLQVPGVGAVIAAALQSQIGDIGRFPTVKTFAAYTGLVPRTNLTAGEGKPGQRITKGGSNLIKQYLFLAAETARLREPALAATYATAISRGKHHNSAIVIVAHKLARAIYALLKRRRADGGPATYHLRRPADGSELSETQAVEFVREHFPSKAELARRTKAARKLPETGSPEGATKGMQSAPPPRALPALTGCGNTQERAVVSSRKRTQIPV
jgi:transposase